jgi:hypothetical protein
MVDFGHFLLQAVASAGGGAVVFLAPAKWFGDKWIDQRFRLQLESFKAKRDEELEQLRQKHETDLAQLNHRLNSRISKIHQKEFEVLPEARLLISRAHGSVYKAICGIKMRPDLRILSDERLEEFLSTFGLSPSQLQDIRSKDGELKRKAIDRAMTEREMNLAAEDLRLLRNHLIQNSIFLTNAIQTMCSQIAADLQNALIDYETWEDTSDHYSRREAIKLVEGIKAKLPELERAIQQRLDYMKA